MTRSFHARPHRSTCKDRKVDNKSRKGGGNQIAGYSWQLPSVTEGKSPTSNECLMGAGTTKGKREIPEGNPLHSGRSEREVAGHRGKRDHSLPSIKPTEEKWSSRGT